VHAQDAVNVDVHRNLIYDHGKVNELLSGQIGDLKGLSLVLRVQGHVHGVAGAVQRNTRALNFSIGRSLDEQLPRLSRTVHPVIHREPRCLGKDQAFLLVVGYGHFTLLGGRSSAILQRPHQRDRARISSHLLSKCKVDDKVQDHGDRNQGRHGSDPGHLVQRRERRFKNPRPRFVFRMR
jgi:hypothetical protein